MHIFNALSLIVFGHDGASFVVILLFDTNANRLGFWILFYTDLGHKSLDFNIYLKKIQIQATMRFFKGIPFPPSPFLSRDRKCQVCRMSGLGSKMMLFFTRNVKKCVNLGQK